MTIKEDTSNLVCSEDVGNDPNGVEKCYTSGMKVEIENGENDWITGWIRYIGQEYISVCIQDANANDRQYEMRILVYLNELHKLRIKN